MSKVGMAVMYFQLLLQLQCCKLLCKHNLLSLQLQYFSWWLTVIIRCHTTQGMAWRQEGLIRTYRHEMMDFSVDLHRRANAVGILY